MVALNDATKRWQGGPGAFPWLPPEVDERSSQLNMDDAQGLTAGSRTLRLGDSPELPDLLLGFSLPVARWFAP